jgi:hypothetical protein
MQKPTFDIHLAPIAADSRILCNEVDISRAIRCVKIHQNGGQLLHLELTIQPFEADVRIYGMIEALKLISAERNPPPEDQNAPQSTSKVVPNTL